MEKVEKLKKEGNSYVANTKYTLAIEKYEVFSLSHFY